MNIKNTLRKLYKRITGSGFLKSVLTLSSGVVVAQAINFLGMPVVSRLYSPAAIGDYTLITSNAAILSAVACLGMMTSFMLPKEHEEARGLSRLVTGSTLLITSLAIGILWLCSGFFRIFHTEQTPYGLSLLVLWLYIVFYTVSNICYAYVNRYKLYRVMFWNPIITAVINVGVGILFGFLDWGFVGYTTAHILAFAVNIIHLLWHANAFAKIENPEYHCIPLLKSYKRFPLFQMPANLVSSLSSQLPIQAIEALFSSAALGMYSMALKILSLPVSLLAIPVNRVYFQEASQRYNRNEDIGEFSFKILETNIKIAILPISLLMIFGEWIFAIFLGEQWREAGTFAAVIGIHQLMLFCSNCLSGYFVIIKKNLWELFFSVATLVSNVLLVIFAAYFDIPVLVFLMSLSILQTVSILLSQMTFFRHTGFDLKRYFLFTVKYIIIPVILSFGIRYFLFS
ncbi:MAG: oligosaccharide flippase family protein [Oscillospiraceae bacterium]|nr:oligosaccharide flippase family protein [Oscillospiraceae bacterium]